MIAVFPLSGTANDVARDKVGFSIRAKIDRDGHFAAIDGPTISDLANGPIALSADPADLRKITADEKPVIFIWGELDGDSPMVLKLKLLDLRDTNPTPREIDKPLNQPTDLRFAVESILQTIPGIGKFAHPSETSVTDDPLARELWKSNPNLFPQGDFADASQWSVLLRAEEYHPPVSDSLPEVNKVVIYCLPGDEQGKKPHHVLVMHLSKGVAEATGLACISTPIEIEPGKRYRMEFRYQSDGPVLQVFVKGYCTLPGPDGKESDVEVYRRQVPESGATGGKWVTILDDMNPQNPQHPVQRLKVDLYAYDKAGRVMFDDVIIKEVGEMTLHVSATQP